MATARGQGDVIVVRYADDIVVGFEHEADARRFWDAMRTRFEQFSLELHPEKTRLIEFGRYAIERRQRNGQGKPQTFDFLGFTFICGRSRRGAFLLRRHTRRDRMRAALRELKDEMRRRRHDSLDRARSMAAVGGRRLTSRTTRCRPMPRRLGRTGTMSWTCGGVR